MSTASRLRWIRSPRIRESGDFSRMTGIEYQQGIVDRNFSIFSDDNNQASRIKSSKTTQHTYKHELPSLSTRIKTNHQVDSDNQGDKHDVASSKLTEEIPRPLGMPTYKYVHTRKRGFWPSRRKYIVGIKSLLQVSFNGGIVFT